jgi:two-component system, NtrC family, sensor kinase
MNMKENDLNIRVLINALPDIVFILSKDGVFLEIGIEKKEYKNLIPNNSLNKNISDIFPDWLVQSITNHIKQALNSGETQICEFRLSVNGNIHDFEMRIAHYTMDQVLCIIRDISARKSVEADTQSFLEKLLVNLPVAVFVKKADDGHFIYWNRAHENLMGITAEQAINKTDFDFFPKEQADWFRKKDKDTFLKGSVELIPEEPIDTPHLGRRILRTIKAPIYDGQGRPLYLLGIAEDITIAKRNEEELKEYRRHLEELVTERTITLKDLKQAQSQLVQSEKMVSLGQLVASIAHEINNPVNFISAGVDSLSTNLEEIRQVLEIYHKITEGNVTEKLKEIEELKTRVEYKEAIREVNKLIESIKNGTNRTTEIVRGLRTFSRLDEDTLKMADIHEGLDSTLILLHNKYKNRIEILKNYGNLPLIECYPGQLNQVFMNILSNTVDAIDEKGIITISTSISNGFIQISIKDTGQGIPENIREKIFDPFFTTKRIGKGTGLGLSISQSIIEKHNGSIDIKSEVGKGSEFVIMLPVKQGKE